MNLKVSILTLALLSTAFAGCIQTAAPVETTATSDLAAPTVPATTFLHRVGGAPLAPGDVPSDLFAEALVRDLHHDASEPTLGVTKGGALFYAAATFETGLPTPRTDFLRSLDNGTTWEDVTPKIGPYNNPPFTFDPYIYVDPATDRVFGIDLYALSCSWISLSDDLGKTWLSNPLACGHPVGVHDHQTITTGKPRLAKTVGYPNMVYYCVNRVADSACASSIDGGLTFNALVPVFPGYDPLLAKVNTEDPFTGAFEGLCGGLHGHVKTAPDGTVFLPKGQCGVPMVAVSKDDGLTWKQVIINGKLGTMTHEVAVAADEAGNVYAFWVARDGKAYLATSTDGGLTFGDALDVTAPGVTAAHLPAIAAAGPGKVAFAYAGTNLTGGYEVKQDDKAWGTATWNGYIGMITNATVTAPVIVTTQINPAADPLVRGHCGPGRCPGMYDFIDIVIDGTGRPWAGFVDACDANCTSEKESHGFGALVATVRTGPSLAAPGGPLPLLAATAPESG